MGERVCRHDDRKPKKLCFDFKQLEKYEEKWCSSKLCKLSLLIKKATKPNSSVSSGKMENCDDKIIKNVENLFS